MPNYIKHFILLFIGLANTYGQIQLQRTPIRIPASYAAEQGPPKTVIKDSLYIFETNDIYLVSKNSFETLRSFYEKVSSQNDMTAALLENYTKTLKENTILQNKLETNFRIKDSLIKRSFNISQNSLLNTQRELDITLKNLERASNNIGVSEKRIKEQRRKNFFEKFLIGIAGIGTGILIGITL